VVSPSICPRCHRAAQRSIAPLSRAAIVLIPLLGIQSRVARFPMSSWWVNPSCGVERGPRLPFDGDGPIPSRHRTRSPRQRWSSFDGPGQTWRVDFQFPGRGAELGGYSRQRYARCQSREVGFPGNRGRGRHDSLEHSTVPDNAHRRKNQVAEGPSKISHRGEVAKIAKNQATRADVSRGARKDPGQPSAQQDSTEGNDGEFGSAATTNNGPQN